MRNSRALKPSLIFDISIFSTLWIASSVRLVLIVDWFGYLGPEPGPRGGEAGDGISVTDKRVMFQ